MQKNYYNQTTQYGDVYLQLFNTSIKHVESESIAYFPVILNLYD